MGGAVDHQFFARLRALNERFATSVPATLERLAHARAAFEPAAPDAALVADVLALLHTMAGSAATFGYRVLGREARSLEQRLRVLTAFESVGAADWDAWLGALDAFVAWGRHNPKAAYYISELGG